MRLGISLSSTFAKPLQRFLEIVLHLIAVGVVNEVQEFKESAKWYRKAAEQGHVDAQVSLGGLYELGYGVKKDHVIAFVWYNIAAENGDTEWGAGWKNVRELAGKMTHDQIAKAGELSKELIKKNPKLIKRKEQPFLRLSSFPKPPSWCSLY